MSEIAVKFDNVSKEYRLGAIGGGTLKGDLQSWIAKKRGKEDPNSIVGSKQHSGNARFKALEGITFEVKKGEALGIIGHNGAGKSTLLKLLSRVTAPSDGTISYNGRIASMLEVGTGFHPELTGRENVYMNGAILGMTKAEIAAKFDDIVEFAEMRQFIDTPVKRYSSGMYVKLAFSVAAHLDSEIMITDEVLAVGDMAFQKKCLDKMKDAAKVQGRTVLYVSHNMNTIRKLCDRCIVLSKGKVQFDGDVEEAIKLYLHDKTIFSVHNDVSSLPRETKGNGTVHAHTVDILDKEEPIIADKEKLKVKVTLDSTRAYERMSFSLIFFTSHDDRLGSVLPTKTFSIKEGTNELYMDLELDVLAPGEYSASMLIHEVNEFGAKKIQDIIDPCFNFVKKDRRVGDASWKASQFGHIEFPAVDVTVK